MRLLKEPPEVLCFRLQPPAVCEAGEVVGDWAVRRATEIRVEPLGQVPVFGSCAFKPADDVALRLVARSFYGAMVHTELRVSVIRPTALCFDRTTDLSVAGTTRLPWRVTPLGGGSQ